MEKNLSLLLSNTASLLERAGITFEGNSTFLLNRLTPNPFGLLMPADFIEKTIFDEFSLMSSLDVTNIEKFLSYVDEKNTIPVPATNLYYSVMLTDKLELSMIMSTMVRYGKEMKKDHWSYRNAEIEFSKAYESGYLPYFAMIKFKKDLLEAVQRDVTRVIHSKYRPSYSS